ncbi:coagulation factor 5/8 type domain-containing protein, partial [Streptomyces pharetrae]
PPRGSTPPSRTARTAGHARRAPPGPGPAEVADSATSHQAYGLGSYCCFNVNPSVTAERAVEIPHHPDVRFRNMVTVSLGGTGTIRHVVNDRGRPSKSSTNVANLVSFP